MSAQEIVMANLFRRFSLEPVSDWVVSSERPFLRGLIKLQSDLRG